MFAPYAVQPPATFKYWLYVAAGAGVTLVIMALAVGSFMMGENKGAGIRPPPVATAPGQVAPPPKVPTEARNESGSTPTKEAAPTKTPPAGDSAPTRAEVERTSPSRVERSMRDPGSSPSRRKERSNRHNRGGSTEPDTESAGGEVISPPSPSEKASDDAFEREFGGTKKEVVARKEEPKKSGKGPSVYVPPAPGAGAELPEELGQGDIFQVLLANKARLATCRDEQKKKDPNVEGTLVMRWTILPSGRTSNISVVSDEFKTTYFANCVAGAIKGWTFPGHRKHGGQVVDGVPFKF
jgi:hypothetical protein